jgi:hypothetical protein
MVSLEPTLGPVGFEVIRVGALIAAAASLNAGLASNPYSGAEAGDNETNDSADFHHSQP